MPVTGGPRHLGGRRQWPGVASREPTAAAGGM